VRGVVQAKVEKTVAEKQTRKRMVNAPKRFTQKDFLATSKQKLSKRREGMRQKGRFSSNKRRRSK